MSITSGINAGSNAAGYEQFIIFAIDDQSPLGINQFINWLLTEKIGYKRLIGYWEGQFEASYIVSLKDWNESIAPSEFAYKQHSVIHLSEVDRRGYRDAVTVFCSGSPQYGKEPVKLGKFMSVGAKTAMAYTGWSYDMETKTYYVGLDTPVVKQAA